jgi:phosphatidylglycerophosphate synthase
MSIDKEVETIPINSRPIQTRNNHIAVKIASALTRARIKPNTISVFSILFSAIAGVCFAVTLCPFVAPSAFIKSMFFVFGAICVQFRLLCNLFDGMVAVEGGFKTKSGEIFNELPDRFSDVFILIGFGYAANSVQCGVELGYIAAVLSVITAYIRALGAATGAGQNFMGPMAKQHRMAVVTIASIFSAIAVFWSWHAWIVMVAFGIMIAGMIVTIVRRTLWVIRTLENK